MKKRQIEKFGKEYRRLWKFPTYYYCFETDDLILTHKYVRLKNMTTVMHRNKISKRLAKVYNKYIIGCIIDYIEENKNGDN